MPNFGVNRFVSITSAFPLRLPSSRDMVMKALCSRIIQKVALIGKYFKLKDFRRRFGLPLQSSSVTPRILK